MTLQNFIKTKPYLIWSTRDYQALNNEAVVEAVLNYGNWDDVQRIIKIAGIKTIAAIFKKKSRQKRCNYRPDIKHYFSLFFNKYA